MLMVLNEAGFQQATSTVRIKAIAEHPNKQREQLDLCLVNDGTPCTPRIKQLISHRLGGEWKLLDWVTTGAEF